LSDQVGEDGRPLEESIPDESKSPEYHMEVAEAIKIVNDVLTPKERQMVVLYYEKGMTLKEIGETMGVSEGRICQMHSAILRKAKTKLESHGIQSF